ncbi:hypothetical protein StoSoilB19_11060 [Arthrobacter sp. StoSoilB19]|nr:hypothetical protein StoSoilB19_11060 [Arthrobacter sp. StoSoilB19]
MAIGLFADGEMSRSVDPQLPWAKPCAPRYAGSPKRQQQHPYACMDLQLQLKDTALGGQRPWPGLPYNPPFLADIPPVKPLGWPPEASAFDSGSRQLLA